LLFPRLATSEWWGEKRTNAYREEMAALPNVEFQQGGDYLDVFVNSDAMIHDCGSFILEYLYMQNPVMYLTKGDVLDADANLQTRQAFEMHYKGCSKQDIESFIRMVIDGEDEMKEVRRSFYDSHLIPLGGTSVCDNVINAILGE
jgi:CDP-glycerol glycerophosphotransferase (TagB/SpsB family)